MPCSKSGEMPEVSAAEFWVKRPIQREGSMPLWLQLKHVLRDMLTFDLEPGDQLPTEAQLSAAYALSRVTVRQAITSLVDDGLLERRQGRGTFILSTRLAETLSAFRAFLLNGFDVANPSDIKVHSVEVVRVPERIGTKLGLHHDADVFKIRKVLTASGEMVAFRTSFVPSLRVPRLLDAHMKPALIITLEEKFGLHLVHAEETIEFIVADDVRAEMLGVMVNHPTILMERVVSMNGRIPAEFSRPYYKTDRFRFRRSLERDSMREIVSEHALTLS